MPPSPPQALALYSEPGGTTERRGGWEPWAGLCREASRVWSWLSAVPQWVLCGVQLPVVHCNAGSGVLQLGREGVPTRPSLEVWSSKGDALG